MFTKNNLLVTNTYPAFLKVYKNADLSNHISSQLAAYRTNDQSKRASMEDFNCKLNQAIRDLYDSANVSQAARVYKDGSALLFENFDRKYELFLLETNNNLILLNFEPKEYDGYMETIHHQ